MRMQWFKALTLDDFGECTALWLEGKLPHMPTSHYCASVSPETVRLTPVLARLNRSGLFVTTQSQPACTPERRDLGGVADYQRAAVMGFVPPKALMHLLKRTSQFGAALNVRVSSPGSKAVRSMQLVTRHKGRDLTRFGYVLSRKDIAEHFGGVPGWGDHPGLSRSVITALQGCYQVSIMDFEWGRNGLLWPMLEAFAS